MFFSLDIVRPRNAASLWVVYVLCLPLSVKKSPFGFPLGADDLCHSLFPDHGARRLGFMSTMNYFLFLLRREMNFCPEALLSLLASEDDWSLLPAIFGLYLDQ